MNSIIQNQKIDYKLKVFQELIKELSKYNNIDGYYNQKKFIIKINYLKDPNNDIYYYSLKILRGFNNPTNIFNMRFISETVINDKIAEIINSLIKSEYFLYTSYTTNDNKMEKYNIILKNSVLIEVGIKDEIMLNFTKNIEKQFKNKIIRVESFYNKEENKDKLQKEKIVTIFNMFIKIFNLLGEYNSISNYENIKPYKFKICNYYNKDKGCYLYKFFITRGTFHEEEIFSLNASIVDNDIVYKMINKLVNDYINKDIFLYDTIKTSSYNDNYTIHLKNNMEIVFLYGNERDRFFYREIYNKNKEKHVLKKVKQ